MAHNLFVSYELAAPGQSSEAVIDRIKSLGPWAKVHHSLFYVRSHMDSNEAATHVRQVMDPNDKVIVIEGRAAHWFSLPAPAEQRIKEQWHL